MVLLSRLLWLCTVAGVASATPTRPFAMPMSPETMQLMGRSTQAGGGTCDSGDFVAPVAVGATSGTAFCESDWGQGYLPITNLTVWSNANIVTGIQATYSDGSVGAVLGRTATAAVAHVGVSYATGDSFDRISLYGPKGSDTYVHHLLVHTAAGKLMNAGSTVSTDPNAIRHDQPVGTGILFGISGTTNSAGSINNLAFHFLATPIAQISITNIQFPNGPVGTTTSISPTTIGTAHFYNNGSQAQQYQFNNQLSEMQQWAYAQAYTNTFTVQEAIAFEFDLSALIVGTKFTSTTTFIWTTTTMTTTTLTVSKTSQVQYNAQIVLQPGQGQDCLAIAGQGAGTFAYSSTVTLTLKNGNKYSFPESGYITVNAISQGIVQCNEADHP